MDREHMYRSLWGPGGAYDRISALQGLGQVHTPEGGVSVASAGFLNINASNTALLPHVRAATTRLFADTEADEMPVEGGPAANPANQALCDCMMGQLVEASPGTAQDPQVMGMIMEQCLADPEVVRQVAAEQGLTLECRPLYKQPRVWIGVGAAVLALGGLYVLLK